MEQRVTLDFGTASPSAMRAMLGLEKAVQDSSLEKSLIHILKLRVSQINGCAFCMNMHATEALDSGEQVRRLHTLVAWRETTWFTEREKAALSWAETLTQIAVFPHLRPEIGNLAAHFDEKEIADLTLAIVAINGWNRIAIGYGKAPDD